LQFSALDGFLTLPLLAGGNFFCGQGFERRSTFSDGKYPGERFLFSGMALILIRIDIGC